jgi:hypothetical protein
LTLKIENEALEIRDGALPPTRAEIHRASMTQISQRPATRGSAGGRQQDRIAPPESPRNVHNVRRICFVKF